MSWARSNSRDAAARAAYRSYPLRRSPEVRARLTQAVDNALDRAQLRDLIEERALAHDAMDVTKVHRIREEMERAEARRLQPHYIESFFLEAFKQLGGNAKQREPRRYEVTHVPAPIRNRDRLIGFGEPVLPRYERIAFEKSLDSPTGSGTGCLRLSRASPSRCGHRPHAGTTPRSAAPRNVLGGRPRSRNEPTRLVLSRTCDSGREHHAKWGPADHIQAHALCRDRRRRAMRDISTTHLISTIGRCEDGEPNVDAIPRPARVRMDQS